MATLKAFIACNRGSTLVAEETPDVPIWIVVSNIEVAQALMHRSKFFKEEYFITLSQIERNAWSTTDKRPVLIDASVF